MLPRTVLGGGSRLLQVEHPARQEPELSGRSGGPSTSATGYRACGRPRGPKGGSTYCVHSFMSETCA